MNLATEIKKAHKAAKKANDHGAIIAPLSDKAKECLRKEGYKIGEVETPCGCGTFNTIE